jgi:hypothetical protein
MLAGKPSAKASANLAPGDELHLAGLHVANSALDLLGPGRLDTLIGRLVEALKQGARDVSSTPGRKLKGVPENLCSLSGHESILSL